MRELHLLLSINLCFLFGFLVFPRFTKYYFTLLLGLCIIVLCPGTRDTGLEKTMKSLDIVILFKLIYLHTKQSKEGTSVFGDEDEALFSVRSLERYTGISKSQVNLSLNRMYEVGLAKIGSNMGNPKVNKQALLEFIVYGIRYVFPAKLGVLTRGIATSIAAPVLNQDIKSSGDLIHVWSDAQGNEKGLSVGSLHKNVRQAIKGDDLMYDFLVLTDAIRIEQLRTRKIAIDKLTKLLS